jgi:hypothetical protein
MFNKIGLYVGFYFIFGIVGFDGLNLFFYLIFINITIQCIQQCCACISFIQIYPLNISKIYYLPKYTHLVEVGYIIYLILFSQNNTLSNKMHTQWYINLKNKHVS